MEKSTPSTYTDQNFNRDSEYLFLSNTNDRVYNKLKLFLDSYFHIYISDLNKCLNEFKFEILQTDKSFIPFEVDNEMQVLCRESNLLVARNRECVFITTRHCTAELNLKNKTCHILIAENYWTDDIRIKLDFFSLIFIWILREYSVFCMHANSIDLCGKGILIAGESGSGKSTVCISLINRGTKFIADDITVINDVNGYIRLMPLLKAFSFVVKSKNTKDEKDKLHVNTNKVVVDISKIYPARSTQISDPEVILFPSITSEPNSKMTLLDKSQTFIKLIENSAGIMLDRQTSEIQMDILKKLLKNCKSYKLELGRDLYLNPENTYNLIAGNI